MKMFEIKQRGGGLIRCWIYLVVLLCLCFSNTAKAQLEDYDKNRLIDALAEEGMADLLQRLIETDPPSDPVEAKRIEIAQYLLRYTDDSLSLSKQVSAYESALESTRQLIDAYYDHEMRPLWQTDLAEMLLIEYLQVIHQNASQFYEFGIPTPEQRVAFASAVAEAYEATTDADVQFFTLQGELPKQQDHQRKRVNTGQWSRMIEEYYLKRTQFFLAHAAYYTTLLSDDDPFYHNLGGNKRIINQKQTPGEERKRLRVQALRAVEQTGRTLADDAAIASAIKALTGRVRLGQGDFRGGNADFDEVLKASEGNLYHLIAGLGRAVSAGAQKQYSDGIARLVGLAVHPLANDLRFRLLLCDTDHRIRLLAAEGVSTDQRGAAVTAAYQPYLDLFKSHSNLRGYVYQRWAATTDLNQDLSLIPPVVRMAIGETSRKQGQNAIIEAREAGDDQKVQDALVKLDESIKVNKTLTGSDIDPAIRAEAIYNLAMAGYLKSIEDLPGLLDAADLFVRVAESHSGERIGEQAIGDGMTLLRNLHILMPRPAGVDAAYRRAAEVLFTKYGSSKAADDERVYYAYSIFQQDGKYDQAVDYYSKVLLTPTHPSYFDAHREKLFTMEKIVAQASAKADKQRAITALQRAIESVLTDARKVEPGNVNRQRSAHRAVGGARLVQAQLAYDQNEVDEALAHLEGFETTFEEDEDLVVVALKRRIIILSDAQRPQQLAEAAQQMMLRFPDDTAAVIDQVLTYLDAQIDQQRRIADDSTGVSREREVARQKVDALAKTARALADLLAQWAQQQGFDAEQMLAYELIRVKVLLLGGEADVAVEVIGPIIEQFGLGNLQVLHYAGETYFTKGTQQNDEASLIRAAGFYDQIIGGVEAPYPPQYWNAWMRRLQINDVTGQFTEDIPVTVRRLQMKDSNLGGSRYARELLRLSRKYGG